MGGDYHLSPPLVRSIARHIGMRGGAHQAKQALHFGFKRGSTFKMRNPRGTGNQRADHAILHAEFRLQGRDWPGIIRMRHAPGMRKNFDLRDIRRRDPFLLHQLQHHGNRRMRAAAAGELLQRNAGRFQFHRLCPIGEDFLGIMQARAVIDIKKALLVFHHAMARFKTLFGH